MEPYKEIIFLVFLYGFADLKVLCPPRKEVEKMTNSNQDPKADLIQAVAQLTVQVAAAVIVTGANGEPVDPEELKASLKLAETTPEVVQTAQQMYASE